MLVHGALTGQLAEFAKSRDPSHVPRPTIATAHSFQVADKLQLHVHRRPRKSSVTCRGGLKFQITDVSSLLRSNIVKERVRITNNDI